MKMRAFLLISAVCVQLGFSLGYPDGPNAVGAYSYQDSSGNRYGGTYGLQDGQVFGDTKDLANIPFSPFAEEDFFPQFLRNFQNLLQEAFKDQLANQDTALNAARKAYDLTSNAALNPGFDRFSGLSGFPAFGGPPLMPHFGNPGFGGPGFGTSGLGATAFGAPGFGAPGFGNTEGFGMQMPSYNMQSLGQNSAFAGAAAGPGLLRQSIALNPQNPNKPNIDVVNYGESGPPNGAPKFYSVSSTSYSSSSNVNGKEINRQGGESIVNDNGKVTAYKLHN